MAASLCCLLLTGSHAHPLPPPLLLKGAHGDALARRTQDPRNEFAGEGNQQRRSGADNWLPLLSPKGSGERRVLHETETDLLPKASFAEQSDSSSRVLQEDA